MVLLNWPVQIFVWIARKPSSEKWNLAVKFNCQKANYFVLWNSNYNRPLNSTAGGNVSSCVDHGVTQIPAGDNFIIPMVICNPFHWKKIAITMGYGFLIIPRYNAQKLGSRNASDYTILGYCRDQDRSPVGICVTQ